MVHRITDWSRYWVMGRTLCGLYVATQNPGEDDNASDVTCPKCKGLLT